MPEGKPFIGYAETVALLVYFIVSKVFLSYHVVAVDRAATAAWQVVLLTVMVGGSVLLAVLVALLRPFLGGGRLWKWARRWRGGGLTPSSRRAILPSSLP
ncbi:MAG: hypothetical protein ACUVRC_04245 [Desulfotomaculales bacterium]